MAPSFDQESIPSSRGADRMHLHPLETFRPSDIPTFNHDGVQPTLCLPHKGTHLHEDHSITLVWAHTSHLSIESLRSCLDSATTYHPPLLPNSNITLPIPNHSASVPIRGVSLLKGYVSPRHREYFVWEGGIFKAGDLVCLGDSMDLARVGGVSGLGRNYFLIDLDVVEKQDSSAPNIRKMVVSSALPSSFQLSFIQRIIYNVFRPCLSGFSRYYDAERDLDVIKFKEMASN